MVREFMSEVDQKQKAIVFCSTQDHAARVRDMINQIKVSTDADYCHRVTANDGPSATSTCGTFRTTTRRCRPS
jgi:type I restriction enzyme, R subunit